MTEWSLQAVAAAMLVAFAAYVLFNLALSSRDERRRQYSNELHRRFERREAARRERRKQQMGPPAGLSERRQGPRRLA